MKACLETTDWDALTALIMNYTRYARSVTRTPPCDVACRVYSRAMPMRSPVMLRVELTMALCVHLTCKSCISLNNEE